MWYITKPASGKGFCRSVPMWRIGRAIKRTSEHDTSEQNTPTLWLSRWGARAEIHFIPDTKIAVHTPNVKMDPEMSPSCTTRCHKRQYFSHYRLAFLSLLKRGFGRSGDRVLLSLPPPFIFLLYLLLFSSHFLCELSTLLPSVPLRCSIQFPHHSVSLLFFFFSSLSHIERWREFKSPPCLCPFFVQFFFPSQTLGCIKHNDILGEMPRRLCLWSVWPPQASSGLSRRGHFTCHLNNSLNCLYKNTFLPIFVNLGNAESMTFHGSKSIIFLL